MHYILFLQELNEIYQLGEQNLNHVFGNSTSTLFNQIVEGTFGPELEHKIEVFGVLIKNLK